MVLHLMRYCVDTTVHRSLLAEIHDLWKNLFLTDLDSGFDQIFDSLILCCTDRDHRDSKFLRHLPVINRSTISSDLVHHIQSQNHWNMHL